MKNLRLICLILVSLSFIGCAQEKKKRHHKKQQKHWSLFKPFSALWNGTALSYLSKDNFHVVEKDLCYRSRQIKSTKRLKKYIDRYDIKIILNLQLEGESQKWIKREQQAAREKGVEHNTISLQTRDYPTATQMKEIIDVLHRVEQEQLPLLIHCKHGIDRTGLISALVEMEIGKKSKKKSKKQQSFWRHGTVDKQLKETFNVWHDLRIKEDKDINEALVAYEELLANKQSITKKRTTKEG